MKAEDIFETIDEFDELLDDAEMNASTEWETAFVSDMRDKFDQYGMNTFMSDAQVMALEKISNRG